MLPTGHSASPRTTADRSEGWATNRPAISPVKLNRTMYLAIAIPLQGACRPDRCLPSSIAPVTTSGNTRDRTSGGRLPDRRPCNARPHRALRVLPPDGAELPLPGCGRERERRSGITFCNGHSAMWPHRNRHSAWLLSSRPVEPKPASPRRGGPGALAAITSAAGLPRSACPQPEAWRKKIPVAADQKVSIGKASARRESDTAQNER